MNQLHYRITNPQNSPADMIAVQILGISGSQKTVELRAKVIEALERLGWELTPEEIGEIDHLMQYDIIGIPALVIGDQVWFQQDIPEVEAIIEALQDALEQKKN